MKKRNSSTSLCARLGNETQDGIHILKNFWALFKEQNLTKTPSQTLVIDDQVLGTGTHHVYIHRTSGCYVLAGQV